MRRRLSRFAADLAEKNKNEPSHLGRPSGNVYVLYNYFITPADNFKIAVFFWN